MKAVVRTDEGLVWEAPEPNRRRFGLMFERDITPTKNIAAGVVVIPPKTSQPKTSVHPSGEEIYLITQGRGKFRLGNKVFPVRKGTAVYVAPGVAHQAFNTGDENMELFWVNTPPVFGPVGSYVDIVKGWQRIKNPRSKKL